MVKPVRSLPPESVDMEPHHLELAIKRMAARPERTIKSEEEWCMASYHLNRVARDLAVEQSIDAAIELDEFIRKDRSDAPALARLAATLMGCKRGELNTEKRDLFRDSQTTSLYHRAVAHSASGQGKAGDLNEV